ncbi:MAG TPA: PaaI family thioesterase [Dehalococcoidia bacterium]
MNELRPHPVPDGAQARPQPPTQPEERPFPGANWSANPCFGCGPDNPHGLKLTFHLEEGRAVARFHPQEVHQGFAGTLHGGLLATLLDEALIWALVLRGVWAHTARLNIRYRRPVPMDTTLVVTGELVRNRGRSLLAHGRVSDEAGTTYAEAEGLFFRMPDEVRDSLWQRYGIS